MGRESDLAEIDLDEEGSGQFDEETTSTTRSTCSGRVGVTSMVSARYTVTSGRRLFRGTSWSRTSKSVSAFQSGPAATSKVFARSQARRRCRLDALGLTRTIPSTISMPAHCSSVHAAYCSAVTCSCIQAGATISTVIHTSWNVIGYQTQDTVAPATSIPLQTSALIVTNYTSRGGWAGTGPARSDGPVSR